MLKNKDTEVAENKQTNKNKQTAVPGIVSGPRIESVVSKPHMQKHPTEINSWYNTQFWSLQRVTSSQVNNIYITQIY